MSSRRRTSEERRLEKLQRCQRRLEYLSNRLQDLALEIGDGQGAVWLKENTWFLERPAMYFDDVLFSVGKICNHLVSYLTFHKQKLVSCFPFLSFMGILYEVGEVLGSVRDLLLANPKESISVKQTQIDLFWTDCTPFLFVFENSNHLLLTSRQIPIYMRALLDLVPSVIQVGMCMYCAPESKLRGFDSFAETCIRLSKALVESGEFLTQAEQVEPVIVPFLRQWILYALELVQDGVKVRTDIAASPLSPRVTEKLQEVRLGHISHRLGADLDKTVTPSFTALSLSENSSLPDDVAESCLAPLKIRNTCQVRIACQPFRWIEIAMTRVTQCPNEKRKHFLEEISLKENQILISDIFLLRGQQPRSWKGVKVYCPITKMYDEVKIKLFIKVKVGDDWVSVNGEYDTSFDKGHFMVFNGCAMNGFVAIEERPLTSRQIGPDGGKLTSPFDDRTTAYVSPGSMAKSTEVKMMIQPEDKMRARQYRDTCPDDFRHVKSTSSAIEINGTNSQQKNVAIKIPFNVLKDPNTKILVLRYIGDRFEVTEAEAHQHTEDNCYTVNSGDEGTVLAAVDQTYNSGVAQSIHREMEVLLGKKQLCKLLIFVETQQSPQRDPQQTVKEVIISVVCAEKYRVTDLVSDKSKVGLIELPKSQSTDRLLKQADEIKLEMKGSVSLDPDIPEDAYTLTYLEGSDNYVRFPVNIVDYHGKMTLILRLGRDNSVLHTFFCSVEEILSLAVSGKVKPKDPEPAIEEESIPAFSREQTVSGMATTDDHANDLYREASLKILNRNSLVNLAKYIKNDESHLLGVCLGLKTEKLSQIYRMYRHSSSLATFYVLYEWRGRKTDPEQADTLIRALISVGRKNLAEIVTEVRQLNRGLVPEDFAHLTTRKGKR